MTFLLIALLALIVLGMDFSMWSRAASMKHHMDCVKALHQPTHH